MSLTEPEIEAAPWEGQQAADDAPYRRQIAYLFERSRFYRDKLGRSGFTSAELVGGLADIARLPNRKGRAAGLAQRRRADRDPLYGGA